jgi:hypothetical protein
VERAFGAFGARGRRYSGAVPPIRYRCTACGNLTRFDVTTSRRTSAFHHFTVGGELQIEDETVLDEQVESVSCRWCGTGAAVVEIPDEVAG